MQVIGCGQPSRHTFSEFMTRVKVIPNTWPDNHKKPDDVASGVGYLEARCREWGADSETMYSRRAK